jgi:hypothetical protein
MKRKFSAISVLVIFLSNDFYKKPKHVATLSLNQQLVSSEIFLTGCSEFYTMG